MKRILTIYWQQTKGIRVSCFLTIMLLAAAILLRNVFQAIVIKNLINGLSTHAHDHSYLWRQVGIFGIVYVLAQVCFRTGEFTISAFEAGHMRNLRNLAFSQMIRHSHAFFAGNFAGSLVTRQKRFVHSAEVLYDELVGSTLSMSIQVVGIMIVMAFVSPWIVLGIALWVGAYLVNAVLLADRRLSLDAQEAEQESNVTAVFADVIGNVSIMKNYGSSDREKGRFYSVTQNHYDALRKAWNFSNKQNALQGLFSCVVHIGGIAMALHLWISGSMSTGDLVLVTIYAGQLSSTLWDFGKTIRKYSRAIADAKEMVDIIDLPVGVEDAPDALTSVSLRPEQATVDFEKVSFSYGASAQILEDFSLHIPAGQRLAIIGSTGAGKTTLISLLMRSMDPQRGTIRIGPYDIRKDVTQDGFKSCISLVSQNTELFNQTIGENIAYGRPSATREEIMDASRKASIHEFISSLPQGYDTMVGERGVKLSGGQRQRVAIARALLHDAPILILDEATSSLDNVTEREIQSMFENDLRDKTVIVIAHRLSTIRNCDRIVVIEKGTIIQDGGHDVLIEDTDGIYYKMLHSHDLAVKEEVYE